MNLTSPECKTDLSSDEYMKLDMEIFQAIKGYRLASLGEKGINSIVDRLNLEPFYEFLLHFNSANDRPYHNLYHAQCMLLNCYEGAWHLNVEADELRGLCAAALLHDFGHSGGIKTDVENIAEALQGLKQAQTFAKFRLVPLSTVSLEIAANAIKATVYPFVYTPRTTTECLIRDADLMQAYEESSFKLIKQYVGLKREIELQRQVTFTSEEFAAGMKKFLDTEVEWYTEWARSKATERNWELAKSNLYNMLKDL